MLNKFTVLPVLLFSVAGTAYADQWVTPPNNVEFVKSGTFISVLPKYDVTAPQTGELTGLGLRMHFDSSKLSFGMMNSIFESGLQGVSDTPQLDTDDYDGDPSTDMYVSTGWLDLSAKWPGNDVIPLTLYDLSMVSMPDFNGITHVNFSDSSHATSGEFKSESLAVCAMPEVTLSHPQGIVDSDNSAIAVNGSSLNGLAVSIPEVLPQACGSIEISVLIEGGVSRNLEVEMPVGEKVASLPSVDLLPEEFSVTASLIDGEKYWFETSRSSLQFEVQRGLPEVIALPVNDEITEGQNKQVFTLERLADDISESLMVSYDLSGTAEIVQDYTFELSEGAVNVSVPDKKVVFEIPAMKASVTVNVLANTDTAIEGDESITLAAVESQIYTINPPLMDITLKDATVNNIATIAVDVLDAIAIEDGEKTASFELERSGGTLAEPLMLSLQENAVSGAKYGVDYQLRVNGVDYSGTFVDNTFQIEIPANERSVVVTIVPIGDSLEEEDELLQFMLLSSGDYSSTQVDILLSVQDEGIDAVEMPDDAGSSDAQTTGKPDVSLIAIDTEAGENEEKEAKFKLARSGGDTSEALVIALEVLGKAKLGEDYHLQISGEDYEGNNEINIVMIEIPAGETELEISIVPVDDDKGEGWESIQISIAKSGSYNTQTPDDFSFVVIDNDNMSSVSIPTVSEWMLFLIMLGLISVAVTQRDKFEFRNK